MGKCNDSATRKELRYILYGMVNTYFGTLVSRTHQRKKTPQEFHILITVSHFIVY
jgi:hypothetical protein